MTEYPIIISPLSVEDGGGFVGFAPDLAGCVSDGETQAEALANTIEAVGEWIETANRRGMKIPEPHSAAARARAEKEGLIDQLRNAVDQFDHMDDRLCALEGLMHSIQERLDHEDEWQRFAATAAVSAIAVSKVRLLS